MILLLRYWPIAVAVLLLGGLFAYDRVAINSADKAGYARAVAKMQHEISLANANARTDEQAAQQRANEVDRDHQQALTDLDAKYAARPVPAVRLCPPAASSPVRVPPATAAASGDPGPAVPDRFPGGSPSDIGPQLEKLVRAADEQTQRLISCQAFAREIFAR